MDLPNADTATQCPATQEEVTRGRPLPSGRSVVLRTTAGGEVLEVRSAGGEVEVRVVLTDQGPVVHLSGARLELAAADTVALNCRRLEINTAESIRLQSAGDLRLTGEEMRVQTTGDIHLNGDVIRLNC